MKKVVCVLLASTFFIGCGMAMGQDVVHLSRGGINFQVPKYIAYKGNHVSLQEFLGGSTNEFPFVVIYRGNSGTNDENLCYVIKVDLCNEQDIEIEGILFSVDNSLEILYECKKSFIGTNVVACNIVKLSDIFLYAFSCFIQKIFSEGA